MGDMFKQIRKVNNFYMKNIFREYSNKNLISQSLIYSEYGEASKVVKIVNEEIKPPGPNEVTVKMLAAPINPADINTIQGVYPVKPPLPSVGGNEGVGEIIAIGPQVTEFDLGNKVIPITNALGTWRTIGTFETKNLLKIPQELGTIEAATLTVNPCTAYRMLKDFVSLQTGDTVIQNGANSSVGQNVVQICNHLGLKSVNIVRNRADIKNLKSFLSNLGATYVFTEEELKSTKVFKSGEVAKPKLALNCVGGKNGLEVLRQLDKKGCMVTYGGMSREPIYVTTSALIFKDIQLRGFWMTEWNKSNSGNEKYTEMMEFLFRMYLNGDLKAPTHKLINLENFQEALLNTMSVQGFSGHKYILVFDN